MLTIDPTDAQNFNYNAISSSSQFLCTQKSSLIHSTCNDEYYIDSIASKKQLDTG